MSCSHDKTGPRLFGFLLALYIATGSGHFGLSDDGHKLAVARSFVEGNGGALPAPAQVYVTNPDGRVWSVWAPGTSIVMAVTIPVADALAHIAGLDPLRAHYLTTALCTLWNGLFSAATAWALFSLAQRLGSTRLCALLVALGWGLGTQAWPAARTCLSEVPAACFITLAFRLSLANGTASAVGAGLCLGSAALFCYPPYLLAPFVFFTCGLGGSWGRAGAAAVGLGVATIPNFLYNHRRFGAWWTTGYGSVDRTGKFAVTALWGVLGLALLAPLIYGARPGRARLMVTALTCGAGLGYAWIGCFDGLFRHLLSPGDGVLWYSPPLILSVLCTERFLGERGPVATVLGAAGLIYLITLAQGAISVWSWGSRYVLPVLPLALLPLMELPALCRSRPSRQGFAAAVLSLGLVMSVLGLTGSSHVVKNDAVHRYGKLTGLPVNAFPYEAQPVYNPGDFSPRQQWLSIRAMDTWGLPDFRVTDHSHGWQIRGHVPDYWWVMAALAGVPHSLILALVALAFLVVAVAARALWRSAAESPLTTVHSAPGASD